MNYLTCLDCEVRMDRRMNKPAREKTTTSILYMDFKEILREHALRYLPAKALLRSRAVCRDWKLQISTPFFIHNQSVSFSSLSGIFLQSSGEAPSFISLDQMAYGVPDYQLKFLPEPVDLKASSNGLLLCQGHTGGKAYYVCNPVNKQWKKLSKPNADHGLDPAFVLVFEPSLLNFMAEFKVVSIFASNDIEEAYEFEIYSSCEDSWKVSSEMFFSSRRLTFSRGIAVNGVAYWPTNSGKILIFDLKKEKAMETYGCGYYRSYGMGLPLLGMMNGKVCKTSMNNHTISISVLETIHANTRPMRSVGNGWSTKQVLLDSKDVDGAGKQVLLTWDTVTVFTAGGKVYAHDLKINKMKLCSEARINSNCRIFPYVNSLVSLS